MAAAPPRLPPSPPALPVELVEEILLRLPPDEPKWLLRASVVCKTWGGAVSHHGFRRRLHELHRAPPVLGFLHNWANDAIPRFIHTTSSSFSLAAPDRRSWRALDCRHGRALLISQGQDTQEILLWEPITGAQERIPVPAAYECRYPPNAAVVCAADGCDHRDCHGGPFLVVLLFIKRGTEGTHVTSACVYSSQAGRWGELTSMHAEFDYSFAFYSSVLVGRSLLYSMSDSLKILEYDLARHSLNVSDAPDHGRSNLILTEEGGLGVIQDFDPQLKLWSREIDVRWVLSRVICLENLLPNGAIEEGSVHVMGFAEGANVIFVTTAAGLFTIELQSQRVRKVCDDHGFCNLIPVVGFYTPHSRLEALGREHHYQPLPPSPTEEVGGKEEGGENNRADAGLFDKCKAMEEGNFNNASDCFGHALKIRDPCYGEVAPECASMEDKHGHAFPSEAQEVTDTLGDVPVSALNEELVKSTSTGSKDDAGNSKTSGSNVEDDAPTSEKGDSEEVHSASIRSLMKEVQFSVHIAAVPTSQSIVMCC